MKKQTMFSLALAAVVVGGVATAGDKTSKQASKEAANNAGKAAKALKGHDGVSAVAFAEAAVARSPQSASYRMLLGQTYLQAGRFVSARQAFAETLQLNPENGKAALNLALAAVATGDNATAHATLDRYAQLIPVSDLGLAIALAGDPAGAVTLLTAAARRTDAGPQIRQNLALSLALAGQWNAARMVAAADISPADVDRRMEEWAAFAQPVGVADQVASLLGVSAQRDGGIPVALALNTPRPAPAAPATATAAVTAPQPIAPAPMQATAFAAPMRTIVPAAAPVAQPVLASVAFGPRLEVVQPLPAPMLRSAAVKPAKLVAFRAPPKEIIAAKGDWYVQLGAFENAAVAKDGWKRATRRYAALAAHKPTGMTFTSGAGSFYRLSVGGFTRGDADATCRRYRSSGGICFVRRAAGDQMVQWLRTPLRVASLRPNGRIGG